jgi:hypothetical protein
VLTGKKSYENVCGEVGFGAGDAVMQILGGRPEMRIWWRRGQRCGGGWHILLVVMKRCALSGGGWNHDRRIRRSRIFGKFPSLAKKKF